MRKAKLKFTIDEAGYISYPMNKKRRQASESLAKYESEFRKEMLRVYKNRLQEEILSCSKEKISCMLFTNYIKTKRGIERFAREMNYYDAILEREVLRHVTQ